MLMLVAVSGRGDVCTDSSGEDHSKYPFARQAVRAPNMEANN